MITVGGQAQLLCQCYRGADLPIWHTWADHLASHRRTVYGVSAVLFDVSMILPLCSQWEPLMGRLDSVRLQVSTAEVWLVTSEGSVMMFGT